MEQFLVHGELNPDHCCKSFGYKARCEGQVNQNEIPAIVAEPST